MSARWTTLSVTLLATTFSVLAFARAVPPLAGRVNDTAGMLSRDTRETLEAVLAEFEQRTKTQFAVLTVDSLQGEPVESFALKVAETWKIGQRGSDNGLVFLIVKNDRKMRFEVGYGLEGRLPDVICKRILDDVVSPRFRAGDFDTGVKAGVAAVISRLAGAAGSVARAPAPPVAGSIRPAQPDRGSERLRVLVGLLVGGVLCVLLLIFAPASAEGGETSSPDLSGAVLFAPPRPRQTSASGSGSDERSSSGDSSSAASSFSGGSASAGTPFIGGGGRFGGGGASSSW